jgi:gamma-glutamyltranspeptidase
MSFGVMGGDLQPQGHLQSLVRMLGYGQQPQAACDTLEGESRLHGRCLDDA